MNTWDFVSDLRLSIFVANGLSRIYANTHAKISSNFSILQRPPIVGILTRHDFTPEHVLGLYPHIKPHK
jgi:hypothetical protein